MHANIKQLLSLRDREPVAAELQQHVDACEQCQRELRQLRTVQSILQTLSDTEQAVGDQIDFAGNWAQVKLQAKNRRRRRQRFGQWTIAASIVTIALVTLPLMKITTAPDNTADPATTTAVQDRQAQLLARNAQLEDALRELPRPPKVMRGGTAYAIASFEDQIAQVDYQLSYGEQLGLDETESVSLLQNRAELLDSLYTVRYTQAMANLANY